MFLLRRLHPSTINHQRAMADAVPLSSNATTSPGGDKKENSSSPDGIGMLRNPDYYR